MLTYDSKRVPEVFIYKDTVYKEIKTGCLYCKLMKVSRLKNQFNLQWRTEEFAE